MISVIYLSLLIILIFNIIPSINCKEHTILTCRDNKISIQPDSLYQNNVKNIPVYYRQTGTIDKVLNINEIIQLGVQSTIKLYDTKVNNDTPMFFERKSGFVDVSTVHGVIFRAFAPENFINIRKLFGITEEFNKSFRSSIVMSDKNSRSNSPGFFYTDDQKFFIQSVSVTDQQLFSSIMSEYFSHICQSPNSLLPKFVGLYYMIYKNVYYYLIVNKKVFTHPLNPDINKVYYIKGKSNEALTRDLHSKNEMMFCLIENDLVKDFKNGLKIPSDVYTDIKKILEIDVQFLKRLKVTDYMFMLIITGSNKPIYNKSAIIQNITNKLNLKTIPDQKLEKRRIIVTYNNKHFSAYIGIINILQKRDIHQKYPHLVKCNYCNLAYTPFISDPEQYANQFIETVTKEVFKQGGTN